MQWGSGFNRYIVECKEYDVINNARGKLDLIDTLWNVKASDRKKANRIITDLIDTLWNVKLLIAITTMGFITDLIDTLWNVKCLIDRTYNTEDCDLIDTLWNVKTQTAEEIITKLKGFNRYIVECKEIKR